MKISLEAARVNRKLTQQQVADAIGISRQAYSGWELRSYKLPEYKRNIVSNILHTPKENIDFDMEYVVNIDIDKEYGIY